VGDLSNGYEGVAGEYIGGRGPGARIGVSTVQEWAGGLPSGASVLDLGCGPGFPITSIFVDAGFSVFGVDASPSMVASFRERFPGVPCECTSVENSTFFDRSFDAVSAWGLVFLLHPDAQAALIRKVAAALRPGGSFYFTAPFKALEWLDSLTGRKSWSLGAEAYRDLIAKSGLRLVGEKTDEGHNHYYMAEKP
jgi:SAM-dependent methyltransferase